MKNANCKLWWMILAACGLLVMAGCPAKKDAAPDGICNLQLAQARGVQIESAGETPVIRVADFPAAFMLTNKKSPGDKTCIFDLVGPEVRPERVFFRQGTRQGINHGKIVEAGQDRVRVSYFVKEHSYGLVLVEPVVSAPDDRGKFSHEGLQFQVSGGAYMRLAESTPLVRSLGPATRISINNPTNESLPVRLLVDNTSGRLSEVKLHGPGKLTVKRIRPLVIRTTGKLAPGQKVALELVPRELKRPFSFVFGGDIKQETPVYVRLIQKIQKESDPLFMLAIGDYTRNCLPWEYQAYFQTMESVTFPVYYVKGNHETHCQGDIHYRRLFAPDRFHFQVDNLLFVVLDSNLSTDTGYRIGDEQLAWLDRVLAGHAGLPWKMITLHVPPHPLHGSPPDAPYLYNLDPKDTRALKELSIKHNVSHVLSGHAHLYARKVEDSVVYLTSGGAGAGLYNYNQLEGFSISLEKHLMILTVLDGGIEEERIPLP